MQLDGTVSETVTPEYALRSKDAKFGKLFLDGKNGASCGIRLPQSRVSILRIDILFP
jgi:hypothetical protein